MRTLLVAIAACTLAGCSAFPDVVHQPQLHNPFPQLTRVAVIPFANQSAEPTVDGDAIALAYFNELQQIPGFEVMPVGVAKVMEMQFTQQQGVPPSRGEDFQRLAQFMDVDAVVVASVTDYSPYYPPRLGLAVRWYAANPCFHPIPPGYGLPWGEAEEEYIPDSLVFEAEFALAKQQLETQTPEFSSSTTIPRQQMSVPRTQPPRMDAVPDRDADDAAVDSQVRPASMRQSGVASDDPRSDSDVAEGRAGDAGGELLGPPAILPRGGATANDARPLSEATSPNTNPVADAAGNLPADWPDPRGFIPPAPTAFPAECLPQSSPVLSLTRLYHGNDAQFTEQLANYYYFRDDARFGGWQSYLQRSDDFIRFCCHLHITELLAARGGAGKTRVVWRWPIGRYER